MESEVFVKIINDTLKSFGFRKQGVRRWIRTGNDISLKVYLQKSQYGAFYYLRDYYVLNKMQVHFSNDKECPGDIVYSDEKILNMMCDLENDVPDSVRETSIKALLKEAFENHQYIETEEELKKMILRRLPCVFKAIMDYLGIAPELYDSLWKQRKNTSMMQRLAKVFEFSPTSDHEILNEEKGFCVTYNIDDQEILIQINIFINPYTQNVEEVYQEKLDKLKYFTKIVLYENPIKEVETIDADKPSKLGFMRVKLTILDHVADTEGIERVKDAIFQIHEEQLPYDSPVWFKAEHDGHACYYEREWWSFKRVVIKGDQGFERYDLSDETKYGQKKCGIVTDIYDQLENDESFELISSAAFQEVWDKAEKSHEQEPWE
jgi:hypothetical protein